MGNDYENVDIEGVESDVRRRPRSRRTATLAARLDRRPAAARRPHGAAEGAAAHLSAARTSLRTMPIDDSRQRARHACRCWCPTASAFRQAEQREARADRSRAACSQLIRTLNKGAAQQHALRQAARRLTPARSSTASCCRRCRRRCSRCSKPTAAAAASTRCSSATLGEWEIATDHAVSGVRTLTVTVSPN